MKIGFFEAEGWEEKKIRQTFPSEEVFVSKDKITSECLPAEKDFEVISVFVNSRLDNETFGYFPNLKCLATRSTGYDHIDISAAEKKAVTALYVPGYGDNTVAEYAFGLILSLTRKIYRAVDQVKETGSFSLAGLRGMDIKGKTLGVIGAGRIGKEVVKIAKGFGMNVLAYDLYPNAAFASSAGITYKTLDELLAESDIVSVHCPYTKETHHLINGGNIGKMKTGSYLINTARGAIVESEALVRALQGGQLAGAGLDVLEEEGETKDDVALLISGHPREEELKNILRNHVLMRMPNVLVTPHNAFNSQEALERILATTLENIKSYIAKKPVNIIPR